MIGKVQETIIDFCRNQNLSTANMNLEISKIYLLTAQKISQHMEDDIKKMVDQLSICRKALETPRSQIIERINFVIAHSFNNKVSIQTYGSYATGFLTPCSDIDMAISDVEIHSMDEAVKILHHLRHNIDCASFILSSKLLDTAAVPVLKLEADPSKSFEKFDCSSESHSIKVDIIVDIPDPYNAVNTAFRTTDYIKKACDFYPSLRANAWFLKHLANVNDFSKAYTGNLIRWS